SEEGVRARRRKIVQAVIETAEVLGNTPAICKSSYIYPAVFNAYDRGEVVTNYFETVDELVAHKSAALHASERALVELLTKTSKRQARRQDPIVMMEKELARRKRAARRSTPHKRAA
ncbi:MAG: hypothetical protein ACJ790_15200, partial [Myxococcaceae bacterium]